MYEASAWPARWPATVPGMAWALEPSAMHAAEKASSYGARCTAAGRIGTLGCTSCLSDAGGLSAGSPCIQNNIPLGSESSAPLSAQSP